MSKIVVLTLQCDPSVLFDKAMLESARASIGERVISAFLGEPQMWESVGLAAYGIGLVSRTEKTEPEPVVPFGSGTLICSGCGAEQGERHREGCTSVAKILAEDNVTPLIL